MLVPFLAIAFTVVNATKQGRCETQKEQGPPCLISTNTAACPRPLVLPNASNRKPLYPLSSLLGIYPPLSLFILQAPDGRVAVLYNSLSLY